MSIKFVKTSISDVIIVEPVVFEDSRGYFMETFHEKKYADAGIDKVFVQDNHSHSSEGVLRGLHYQLKNVQAKLIYVLTGEILDVAVDIRKGSPSFGKYVSVNLSSENKRQLYIPEGFAHGFCVLSKTVDVIYKCSDFYDSGDEYGVCWNDSEIGIEWPIEKPHLSGKDKEYPLLKDIDKALLPEYKI